MAQRDLRKWYDQAVARVTVHNEVGGRLFAELYSKGGKSGTLPEAQRARSDGGGFRDRATDARRIAELSGLRGWVWDEGMSSWLHMPEGVKIPGRKIYDLPEPCPESVSGFMWSGLCCRPIDRNGMCKRHAGHSERRHARSVAHAERWAKQRDEWDRAALVEAELTELWGMACESLGVETRRGKVSVQNASRATVDSEILRTILRRAIET